MNRSHGNRSGSFKRDARYTYSHQVHRVRDDVGMERTWHNERSYETLESAAGVGAGAGVGVQNY